MIEISTSLSVKVSERTVAISAVVVLGLLVAIASVVALQGYPVGLPG